MREAVTGSEVRRFLWASEGSYITLPPSAYPNILPKSLTMPPMPPPSLNHPIGSPQDLKFPILQIRQSEPASPAALSALEEAIPAHMQPLYIQVGGIK